MFNLSDIGRRLQEERKRLGLSQSELGELAGISRAAQAAYEAGRNAADVIYSLKASEAGLDMDYVLTGRRAAEAAWEKFDWDLAAQVMTGIHTVSAEMGLTISHDKQIALLKLLYRLAAREQSSKLDMNTLRDVLRLAA
jgi:transcriptional regulator with XRE-family HTH domain